MALTLLGGAVVIALALIQDAKGTVGLIVAIITVRGITWLSVKMIDTLNKDAAQMVDFAGWCIAGVSVVGLIKLALQSVAPVTNTIMAVVNGLTRFSTWVDNLPFLK